MLEGRYRKFGTSVSVALHPATQLYHCTIDKLTFEPLNNIIFYCYQVVFNYVINKQMVLRKMLDLEGRSPLMHQNDQLELVMKLRMLYKKIIERRKFLDIYIVGHRKLN